MEEALRRHLRIPPGADTDAAQEFTIEQVACLGCCTLAPVVKMGDSTMGYTSAEKSPDQVRDYLAWQTAAAGVKSTEEMSHPAANGFAQIHVGLGSCCMAKGSDQLFHALRESAGQCGGDVTIKRVGCMGMCHRTPMIEVAVPGQAAAYYSDLTPGPGRRPHATAFSLSAVFCAAPANSGHECWTACFWRRPRRSSRWRASP